MTILRQYEEDGYLVTEYTSDGETVSAITKASVMEPVIEVTEPDIEVEQSAIALQTLLNTEFLVIMSEIG